MAFRVLRRPALPSKKSKWLAGLGLAVLVFDLVIHVLDWVGRLDTIREHWHQVIPALEGPWGTTIVVLVGFGFVAAAVLIGMREANVGFTLLDGPPPAPPSPRYTALCDVLQRATRLEGDYRAILPYIDHAGYARFNADYSTFWDDAIEGLLIPRLHPHERIEIRKYRVDPSGFPRDMLPRMKVGTSFESLRRLRTDFIKPKAEAESPK